MNFTGAQSWVQISKESLPETGVKDIQPEKYALYLPRLKKVRDDKTEADTYEKVKESVESIDTLISNIFNYS